MVVMNHLPVVLRDRSVESQVDRLLDDAIRSVNEWPRSWNPACNIFEDAEGFTVQMALPGVEASQIDVQVEKNILRVKGERTHAATEGKTWCARDIAEGAFFSSFRLPGYVDHHQSTASYKQGLLTITFPKREEAKPRQIMIECQ